ARALERAAARARAGRGAALLAGREDRCRATLRRLAWLRGAELRRIAGRPAAVEVAAAGRQVIAGALSQVRPVIAEVAAEGAEGLLLLLALDLRLDLLGHRLARRATGGGRAADLVVEARHLRGRRGEHLEDVVARGGDDRALDLIEGRLEDVVVERLLERAGDDVGAKPALVLRGRVGGVLGRDLLPVRRRAIGAQRLVGQIDLVRVLVLDDPDGAVGLLGELLLVG